MTEQRRPPLDLEKIGIRLGDVLYVGDNPEETCVVVQLYPPLVFHDGQVKSPTEAINQIYNVVWNDPYSAWTYEGESLTQRRLRFEEYHGRRLS